MNRDQRRKVKGLLNDERVQFLLDVVIGAQYAIDNSEEHVRYEIVVGAPWSPSPGQPVPISRMDNMGGAPDATIVSVEVECEGFYRLEADVDAVDIRAWAEQSLTELGVEIHSLQVGEVEQ